MVLGDDRACVHDSPAHSAVHRSAAGGGKYTDAESLTSFP